MSFGPTLCRRGGGLRLKSQILSTFSPPVDVGRRHGERRRHRGEPSILGFTNARRGTAPGLVETHV